MDISGFLIDKIHIAHASGLSASGDAAFSDPVEVKARVEQDTRLVVGTEGNEQQANHRIASLEEIKQTDRVWLPGVDPNDIGKSKRPILVSSAQTKQGRYSFYETFL